MSGRIENILTHMLDDVTERQIKETITERVTHVI